MKYLITLLILILLPFLWLRGGVFQEPFATALQAASLELSSGKWAAIEDGHKFILHSKNLSSYLSAQETDGWQFSEQMGSGYLFRRGEQGAMITCRLYSTRFRICSALDQRVTKQPQG